MLGIASVNHLSDKLSLIPDAESECTSVGLGDSFISEPIVLCSDLVCHDFERIEDVSLAEPADPSQRPDSHRSGFCATYTNSFNPLNATNLTSFLAGLALKTISSLVKGLIPFRSGVAGLRTTLILSRLQMANVPAPS